jgi:hypothetical protein
MDVRIFSRDGIDSPSDRSAHRLSKIADVFLSRSNVVCFVEYPNHCMM